jgi:predicted aspartyl protease
MRNMIGRPGPLGVAGIAAALALSSPLWGQNQPAAPAPAPAATPPAAPAQAAPTIIDQAPVAGQLADRGTAETLGYTVDPNARMTVQVNIAGHGPYPFIVDTGSERTVVSRELASDLAMDPGPPATVHSMTEVSQIPTVVVQGLRVGQRTMADIHAPALARINLGAIGMLGVDTLQTQRVIFDFQHHQMTVMPSTRSDPRWPEGEIVVTARSRFGRLMLIDASLDNQRVYVIIDTGSEISVGNMALRNALARDHRLGTMAPLTLVSVTGGRITADYTIARRMRIGGADINNLPIAFADVHPFRQLQLLDRPAILLGMDALQLFRRVSVDFANRRVRLLTPESSQNGGTQFAGGGNEVAHTR